MPFKEVAKNESSKGNIGPYIVKKVLGEGSFGKVKLATHYKTHQDVALKFISKQTLKMSDMYSRVEREISYLKLLRHPHIIKLYEVITTPTDIIMVIEYAGGELFDYIVQKRKLSEDEARRFFQQIICAIEYCHRHKIVHRDLKPENLLLDANLNVKIADFGLSNLMTDGNFLKTSCGSPNYAAPEVINGKLYAGPEVDVWSCGVILYVMLVGQLPFDDELIPNLFKKINSGLFYMPDWVSSGAKSLIRRMIVVDSMQRITIQGIREDPWFNENLPDYLKPMPELQDSAVDTKILKKLSETMGFSEEEVLNALHDVNENNKIKEAYNILHENQVIKEKSHLSSYKRMDSFLSVSPPAYEEYSSDMARRIKSRPISKGSLSSGSSPREKVGSLEQAPIQSTISILPSSTSARHQEFMADNYNLRAADENADTASIGGTKKKTRKTRWHFGIRCGGDTLEILFAIYSALKKAGAEFTNPRFNENQIKQEIYTIKCRYPVKRDPTEGRTVYAFVELQLYEIMPECYMLDVKSNGYKVVPPLPADQTKRESPEERVITSMPFLDLCSDLILKLFSG
ncbi:CAMK/CAMKL/AMPK protein kinase Ssp2 [Schizosaccharomyces japonicus yFS275]|uniref:non-specific serine/threonine protein kinase n=1 Tax=Schizosaccharomyces japonicus (strain yFS275 / FY16936) TaxID=402676 RepID=B6K4E5_SCHJY|nr:CAMK/CAMKL/AMPK protein kinase Ssp2 [Schizosaccharomyces japonicus yFS275]EEB08352.1 CAMK/CAMKL/AMPK protein kinase Ssp2 [Schizosaccharomyces japonicus yFS275]